jgi:hypothetical protein
MLVLLTACGKGPAAEKRYQMVADGGTAAERCVEAGKVAEAYLSDRNADAYDYWRLQK